MARPNLGSELRADNLHHPWQENRLYTDNTFKTIKFQIMQTALNISQCLHLQQFVLTDAQKGSIRAIKVPEMGLTKKKFRELLL